MNVEWHGSQCSGLHNQPIATRHCPSTHLVSTVLSSGRGELSDKLADQSTGSPELTARVEKGRDLSWDSTVSGRSTDDDTVDLFQVVGGDDGVLRVERLSSVHLAEDFLRERLLAET